MVEFTAHLSVTIKLLTRYKQKVLFAAMLEGERMPFNMAANINHTAFVEKSNRNKISPPKCILSQISRVRSFLCALSILVINKIQGHCLRGHMTDASRISSDFVI